jgi:hypothetical protein
LARPGFGGAEQGTNQTHPYCLSKPRFLNRGVHPNYQRTVTEAYDEEQRKKNRPSGSYRTWPSPAPGLSCSWEDAGRRGHQGWRSPVSICCWNWRPRQRRRNTTNPLHRGDALLAARHGRRPSVTRVAAAGVSWWPACSTSQITRPSCATRSGELYGATCMDAREHRRASQPRRCCLGRTSSLMAWEGADGRTWGCRGGRTRL